ncbi:MAG: xanthine dehydrogenase family protein molybdopterin-binding subunit [Phycisphaerales bacterium]
MTSLPTHNRPINDGAALNNDTSRLDGVAKVTGRAKYGRDMYLPGSLFAAFVRCPYGAATLESVDKDAAMKVPGVVEVTMTGEEGRYHGHNVGYVVAESPATLQRGLRALGARWKRQSVKTTIADAMSKPDDDSKAVQDLLSGAELTLEATYSTEVHMHASLETHGVSIDHDGVSATVYASTQGTSAARDGIEEAIGLPRAKFEVVCEYVGGGFGSKLNGAGKEGTTAARIASKYKKPVYLFCNREEDQLDTGNRPSARAEVKVGFKKDGTVLGGRINSWGATGVARGGGGMSFPSGRYDFGDLKRNHSDVQVNAGSPRPFRAPGHPQGAFMEELMIDEIALKAGLDPLQLRLKLNKSGDRGEMLELGATLIGWANRKPTGSQSGVIRKGFGCGTCTWGSPPQGNSAEVVIHRDGSVEARTGTQDIGTGQRTSMAICTATRLGVPLSIVSVSIGRSTLPPGPGSGGSVTTPISAPAMMDAAVDAKRKLLDLIAQQAGADASEFDVVEGAVVRSGKPHMSWKQACATIAGDSLTGKASDAQGDGKGAGSGHSHGAQFVELDVDADTGVIKVRRVVAIQSCGQVICRKTAESQIIGGVIQGLSYGLFEQRILDRNVGAMVNANLEMYKILGPADMPHIEPVLWTKGQVGVKSIGEPPIVPTAGAVACAVLNAIGRPVRSQPITPDRVLAALYS